MPQPHIYFFSSVFRSSNFVVPFCDTSLNQLPCRREVPIRMDSMKTNMQGSGSAENVKGDPLSMKSKVLETGASMVQDFAPVKNICAHLNAFHAYADNPNRVVETNHYCSHLTEDVRQCLLYDSPEPNARLIGIEYMITPKLYETLEPEERRLWHSHVFEVKSGMLIMPAPRSVPTAAWEIAETKEMEQVIELYGKVYHLWQVDRGDKIPLGEPKLMTSFTTDDQLDFKKLVGDRDKKFAADHESKADQRAYIQEPKIHEDADWTWKEKKE